MVDVLVTGGCGFIGSKIVEKLINKNYNVHVIDNLSTGNKDNIDLDKVTLHVQDINDPEIEEVFKNNTFQYVIHQAAQTSVPVSIEDITSDTKINILGSVHLIDLANKYGVNKIIFASSAAIYGDPKQLPITETTAADPTSPYGLSKYTIEKYLQLAHSLYGLNYTILRYANVYGPKQTSLGEGGVVSIFDQYFSSNKTPIIYGDGLQTRDFIYVDDVAEANIAAIDSENGIYNVSCNEQTTIEQLFQYFKGIYGVDVEPIYESSREGDIRHSILSNELTLKELDWMPKMSLAEGLKQTVTHVMGEEEK
ncbi:NAD-dependent epimerase/dehydratase family protein [Oceanobacillus chungangensis]|uniref:UDP-glucose 4-epimerase n=1 Tax=Oceanobacillus chungangensis TaxID=1229152 RepID=A0A3D8PZ25_9BACI|nr:NAD-dependent epimerase/dehydratase family protein [Oceanobacillus chungangensis]RDW20591.1 UDP-glucose 4-epimerase [Oceanobacillus chungangensis]